MTHWLMIIWIFSQVLLYQKSLITALFIAVMDELYQTTIPGRIPSLLDILLDGIGIILALWIIHIRDLLTIEKI